MKIFYAKLEVDWEPGLSVGVFSTFEKCIDALKRFQGCSSYDDVMIYEVEIDNENPTRGWRLQNRQGWGSNNDDPVWLPMQSNGEIRFGKPEDYE